MACMRCDGFLVLDEFVDLREANGPMEFQGVRCLNCGYVGDAISLANRNQSLSPHLGDPATHGHPWMGDAWMNGPTGTRSVQKP